MGINPDSLTTSESVDNGASAMGIANQITNILGDVGEDIWFDVISVSKLGKWFHHVTHCMQRLIDPVLYRPLKPVFYGLFLSSARGGRIYLPQDELAEAVLSEEDIFSRRVTDKWRRFLKKQIKRARKFFQEAEKGVTELNQASRWPVWTSLLL